MNKQAGATLISLLVGLVIAMLCIIAVLTTYRTAVKTSTESRIDSSHDAQLQNGLTTAQMLLQNAGYGLDGTTHFKVNANITAQVHGSSQSISPAILWRYRYKDNNNIVQIACQGLADISDSSNTKRQLVLLQGTVCNDTLDLASNSLTWKVQSSLANLQDFSADHSNPVQITWVKSLAKCTPYGAGKIDESSEHLVITFSAKTSTQQTANLSPVGVSVCLLNIST